MSDTPLLGLPLLSAAQAQKHVTHNEALLRLDGLIHLSVISRTLAVPPAAPADGDRYLVAASPGGAWAGQAGALALLQGGGWTFIAPRKGWRLWLESEARLLVFDGAQWRDPLAIGEFANLARLGVGTTADDTNRLAVAAAATLLTHAGGDHRLKLNKNAAGDTASLIYQSGWSGRAEMGLAGSDDFRINVSADGASWKTALQVDRASGAVRLPATPPAVLYAQSLTAQATSFSLDGYVAGSGIAVAAGRLASGTRYRLVLDLLKTAAGVAPPVLTLRFGAAAGLTDLPVASLTFPAQTAVADEGRLRLDVTFRSAGATASIQAVGELLHAQGTAGLSTQPVAVRRVTSSPFDATGAGVFGVSLNAGAAAAWSISLVQAQLENLA